MFRQIARWLVSSLALLFVVSVLTFVLASMAPGDAAREILGNRYTPALGRQLRHSLGLDQPLPVQYWHWLHALLHGSLGTGTFNSQPVVAQLNPLIGPSLSLILGTVLVAGLVGVTLGVVSAVRGGVIGRLVDAVSLTGLAMPTFWLALVLVELLAAKLRIFPSTGYTPLSYGPVPWLRSIALPVLTLSAGAVAFIAKQTRDSMAEVMSREFVVMLRARGLTRRSVVLRHALRNAAIPVVTVLGLLLVSLLGGTVLIEGIFDIPGLGAEAVRATSTHDITVVEGVAFYFTIIVVITNLIVDLSYQFLNPQVRRS